jgi:hypothetical protein
VVIRQRHSSVTSDTHVPVRSIGAAARGVACGPAGCCARSGRRSTRAAAAATTQNRRDVIASTPPRP